MKPITEAAQLNTPLAMSSEEFADVGHKIVDKIASFLNDLPGKPVTTSEQPSEIRSILGNNRLPINGTSAETILDEAAELLFNHSLFNGHPSFWGYITSSATPIGALADLLAAAVNPNVGAYALSPMATEIERQTIQWLAEFIGFPEGSSGVFVSGGNMANFIGFLAARKAKATWDIRKGGLSIHPYRHLLVYCSKGTHTWIQKAADLFGLGTNAIRWIDMNEDQQIDVEKLEQQIIADLSKDFVPFLVVGNAGSVSTGAVDPLSAIAKICRQYNLWFHIDGAYGAPAALLPEYAETFKGLNEADSVAIDPHKWLYNPLEAGCILVRNAQYLTDTFSFHPEYYNFDGSEEDPAINYFDYGLQNSRGFRALKVWLGIRQAGRNGYEKMIRNNIELAKQLFHLAAKEEELEAITCFLSITTFRYVPKDLQGDSTVKELYLNRLNEQLLNTLQAGGKVFLSNAVVEGKYCLRVCIVNFRTTYENLEALKGIVLNEGRMMHEQFHNKQHLKNK
jgi:aromatic-L-amino-acid/L-tryptophan decarboxylase